MDNEKTFKSDRAARIAYGKAERAWEALRSARINVQHAQRDPETKVQPTAEERAKLDALRGGEKQTRLICRDCDKAAEMRATCQGAGHATDEGGAV